MLGLFVCLFVCPCQNLLHPITTFLPTSPAVIANVSMTHFILGGRYQAIEGVSQFPVHKCGYFWQIPMHTQVMLWRNVTEKLIILRHIMEGLIVALYNVSVPKIKIGHFCISF